METATEKKQELVEIRIVNPKKAGIFTIGSYWDDEKKDYRHLKYANGNERTYKINGTAQSKTILNISNPDDRLVYKHLQDHPIFVKRANPLLQLRDLEKESEERMDHQETALRAKNIISDLQGIRLGNFARILGIPTEHVSEKTVKLALYEVADRDPSSIIAEWNDSDREFKETLFKGLERRIFKTDDRGVWRYGDMVIGVSFLQALSWLKADENEDLLFGIKRKLEEIARDDV